MNIHEFSIKRPVTVFMCVLIILVLGWVSLTKLSLDLMPNITFPVAIVSTEYQGVGPQEIENIVTRNIESSVATVSNIKAVQSQSSAGSSMVIAEFNSGTDMDFATLHLREKVDLIKAYLPDEVGTPMVIKMDPSMIPVVTLGVTNGSNEVELKKLVEDKIKPRLESLDGVAAVYVTGGKEREIKVEADPRKMSGYGISLNQVTGALQSENLNQPGGTVEYGDKNLLVRSTGEFKTLDQIKNVPIILPSGNVIYIKDVANVTDGFKDTTTHTRMNGKNSVGIVIQKQTGSNTVKVVNRIRNEIEKVQKEYSDVTIKMSFDQGEYIEKSIASVSRNAVAGAVLAVFILFIFLKNIRTTFIIGTAIPISIISTFVMIYFSGITLNLVSLGGLALGVGMLVDSAIVVLENIYRYRSEGYSKIESAILGTQEVGGAITASTLTTVAVFIPIAFAEGIAVDIFKEMAMTVTFSLLASLTVALTFIPMLSSKYLRMVKPEEASRFKVTNKVLSKWDDCLKVLDSIYRSILAWVLSHRKTTVAVVTVIFISSLALLPFIGAEFFPTMDQGQFTVDIELPQGSLLERTNEITTKVEGVLSGIPEIEKLFVSVGSSNTGVDMSGGNSSRGSINATLKPLSERSRSTAEVVDEIRKQVDLIPGAKIKVSEVSTSMGGGSGTAVALNIFGPDLDRLKEISERIEGIIRSVEGTRQVESSFSKGQPEVQVYVDREKASYYGVGSSQVAASIRTAIEGKVATRYKIGGEEYDIRVQYPKEYGETYEQLRNVKIMTPAGVEVPLTNLARIDMAQGPVTISREGQQRYTTVTSDIFGRDVGSINKDIKAKLDAFTLPSGYSIEFGGQEEQMQEAFISLFQMLLLAILLVYMIMASQFESLMHPFIIMFSLPLAFTGSAIGLAITQTPLSVPAFIGIIMLAGIVVNNAIVLVDYVNTLRKRGMERTDAILKAGPTRLRPILMTTLTTILALSPLALGIGEGAESQAPLAIVVIGGLLSSTLLTLVIIPVVYTLFDDIAAKFRSKIKKNAQGNVPA